MINGYKQFQQDQASQSEGMQSQFQKIYINEVGVYKDIPIEQKIFTEKLYKKQNLNNDINMNSSYEQYNNYYDTKSSINKKNTVNSENNTRSYSRQQLYDHSLLMTTNPGSQLQNIHINQPFLNPQFRNSYSKSQMGQRLKLKMQQETSTRNSVNINPPFQEHHSSKNQDITNYQVKVNDQKTNQTIKKRIQTINDEIAKQRQYLPQFKNMKQIERLSESNFNFFNQDSQNIFINPINQMGSSPQIGNPKPNPQSRGGASTTDQSFYQIGSPNNLKQKLQHFKNQKQVQIDSTLKKKDQQSLEMKKKSLKLQGLNNQQINSIIKMEEQNIILLQNQQSHESVIKELRKRANDRPDVDTFNNGSNLKNLTHNLGQNARLFQREYFDSAMDIRKNQSLLKTNEFQYMQLTDLKKKRRNIEYQIETNTKNQIFRQSDLSNQMVKSAKNFNKNEQLQHIKQNQMLMNTTATPILKKRKENIEQKINNLNQDSQFNLFSTQNYQSQKKSVIINDDKQHSNYQLSQQGKIKVFDDIRVVDNLLNANIDKDRDLKKVLSFENQKNVYDSNIKIQDIKKINMFTEQENILQNLEKRKMIKNQTNEKIIKNYDSQQDENKQKKDLQKLKKNSPLKEQINKTKNNESSLPQIQKQKVSNNLQPIQDKRLSMGMPTRQQSQVSKNLNIQKAKVELSTQRIKIDQNKNDFPKIKEKSKIKYKMPSKERRQNSERSNKKEFGSKKKSSQRRNELSQKRSKLEYTTDDQEYINNIEIPLAHQKVRIRSQNQRNFNNSSMANTKINKDGLEEDFLNVPRQQSLSPRKIQRSNDKKSISIASNIDIKKSNLSMQKFKIKRKQQNKKFKVSQSYSDRQISNLRKENNLYDYDPKYFKKIKPDPPLFVADVDQNDYQHLMNDDLDEISKLEVSYKILKQQLREQQKRLIDLKEERQRKIEQEKLLKKKKKRLISPVDLSRFARHIKHFELYGSQRDLSPELKRIVKNLMCQEHKFMYCPKCKVYEAQAEIDPIENIQKFMDYIKIEQEKLRRTKRLQNKSFGANKQKKQRRHELLPDDSASEITYLDEQEILAKYYETNMTEAQRKQKERKKTQQRLYGENKKEVIQEHVCVKQQKKQKKQQVEIKKVKVELRAVEEPQSMHDESNSAHQFSLYDISVQADSEARCDVEMQTSAVEFKSVVNQTSKQDHHSIVQQTSEIEYRSNNMQTSLFGPNAPRAEFSCQTDPKLTTQKLILKQKQMQTQKVIDVTKDDWAKSSVYKKAIKNEALKRNINYNYLNISADEYDENEIDETTQFHDNSISQLQQKKSKSGDERFDLQNAQDPDTDITVQIELQQKQQHSGLGFLKNYWEKGNIQILTQTELQYVKQLLKQKNHELWKEPTTLNDLQRHCKFTIRKLTQQMANLDNTTVFRNLKKPSRQQTLYLVYRAELLFQAYQESEKIFKLFSKTLFEREQFRNIDKNGLISYEDMKFINEREILFRRILTQLNSFTQTYKLFQEIIFQGQPFYDYLQNQLQKVLKCKQKLQEKKLNQENNSKQDNYNNSQKSSNLNPLIDIQNQQQDSIVLIEQSPQNQHILQVENQVQNDIIAFKFSQNAELRISSYESLEIQSMKYDNEDKRKTLDAQQFKQISIMANDLPKKQISLNFNKDNEQDLVGKNTLDIINLQVQDNINLVNNKSEIDIVKFKHKKINDLDDFQESSQQLEIDQQINDTPKTLEQNINKIILSKKVQNQEDYENVMSEPTKHQMKLSNDSQMIKIKNKFGNHKANEPNYRGSFAQY